MLDLKCTQVELQAGQAWGWEENLGCEFLLVAISREISGVSVRKESEIIPGFMPLS